MQTVPSAGKEEKLLPSAGKHTTNRKRGKASTNYKRGKASTNYKRGKASTNANRRKTRNRCLARNLLVPSRLSNITGAQMVTSQSVEDTQSVLSKENVNLVPRVGKTRVIHIAFEVAPDWLKRGARFLLNGYSLLENCQS